MKFGEDRKKGLSADDNDIKALLVYIKLKVIVQIRHVVLKFQKNVSLGHAKPVSQLVRVF